MSNEKKPHFLVSFDPSSSADALKVPFKFRKHIDGTTPGTAFLLGPSGNTWRANLIQCNGNLFLQDGWAEFVRDHILECGDSLLFRYDGDLHFTVRVFDESSCQKEATFNSVCSQSPGNYGCHLTKKRERENLALLDNIIEGIPKKVKSSPVHSEFMTTNQELQIVVHGQPQEEVGFLNDRSEEEVGCTLNDNVTIAVPSIGNSGEAMSGDWNCKEDLLSGDWNCKEDLLLSASEAERVAQSFTSSLPYFTKVMKRFNVSGSYTLNLPYQFAMAHLPKCKVKIVLHNLKGESWTVNSVPTTKVQTLHTFCGGWLGFVRDNNLNVGDFCIFELVKKCELRVCIIRVKRERMGNCSEKEVHEAMVDKSYCKLKKISQRKAKKHGGNSNKASLQQLKVFDKKGQDPNKVKCVNSSQSTSQDLGSLSSLAKGCISLKSAPEEKLAAELFVSSFPHFVKIMKKFNVSGSYTLNIPYQFATDHLPSCRTEIVLRNLKGNCWTVNSIPTIKVRTLHTFCGGWMSFVRDNNIEMGDICIFELVEKNEMRVHISRMGKKGLVHRM